MEIGKRIKQPHKIKILLMKFNQYLWIICACLMACEPTEVPQESPSEFEKGVFIINEGNFQTNNSALDFWNEKTNSIRLKVFEEVNERPLGDVFQSMTVDGDVGYLVVNNSQKIEVIDMETLKNTATIEGFSSPRYLLPIDDEKAYVSDLFSGEISILNLNTLELNGTISLPGWSEQMILAANKIFVSNPNKEFIYIIDPLTDLVEDSVKVAFGGNSLALDRMGQLWVLCWGDYFQDLPGGLYRIDPNNRSIRNQWPFANGESPSKLTVDGTGNNVYFLNQGVYKMDVTSQVLPDEPFIAQDGGLFYGLGIDPESQNIYIGDAVDFVQQGAILRYTEEGTFIDEFRSSIIPSGFYFKK